MRKIIKTLLAGIFVPVCAVTFYQATGSLNKQPVVVKKIAEPYIVQIIDAEGNETDEVRGASISSDPYKIAEDLGAKPFIEDKFTVFPPLEMGITGGMLTLYRAPTFTIYDGRKEMSVRSWAENVGDLLKEAKIPELGVDDKINFSLTTEIENNMEIKINRVAKTTVIEEEPIKYSTDKKSNPNLEKGYRKVLQAGENGIRKKYFAVIREDGIEVSRKLSKTEIGKEPISEIVEVGTKVVVYGRGVGSIWKSSNEMVAACNFVSRGTKINVVNQDNGKSIVVTCMGGGLRSDRLVDLSDAAFQKLGGSWSQGLLKNIRAEKYYPEE